MATPGTIAALLQQPSMSDWFALLSGFGGALIGAVIGGFISYVLATQANKATLARDEAQRLEAAKAAGLKLSIKASLIASDVASTVTAIHSSLDQANNAGMTAKPLWQRIPPIIGISSTFTVEADELSPLVEAKKYELFQQFVEVVMQHDVLNQSITMYNQLRMALKERLSKSSLINGTLVSTELTPEESARLTPYFLEIESLAASIKPRSEELLAAAESVTFAIGPALRAHFSDPSFPVMIKDAKDENTGQ